jgi:hypothetical protein
MRAARNCRGSRSRMPTNRHLVVSAGMASNPHPAVLNSSRAFGNSAAVCSHSAGPPQTRQRGAYWDGTELSDFLESLFSPQGRMMHCCPPRVTPLPLKPENACQFGSSRRRYLTAVQTLKIGCGLGSNAFLIALKTGAKALGTDLCVPIIRQAREKSPLPSHRSNSADTILGTKSACCFRS